MGLWEVDIEVSIAIGIEKSRSGGDLLHEVVLSTTGEGLNEVEAGLHRDIRKFRGGQWRCGGGLRYWRLAAMAALQRCRGADA